MMMKKKKKRKNDEYFCPYHPNIPIPMDYLSIVCIRHLLRFSSSRRDFLSSRSDLFARHCWYFKRSAREETTHAHTGREKAALVVFSRASPGSADLLDDQPCEKRRRRKTSRRETWNDEHSNAADRYHIWEGDSIFLLSSSARHSHTRIHLLGFVILLRPPRSILTGMNHWARNACNVKIK